MVIATLEAGAVRKQELRNCPVFSNSYDVAVVGVGSAGAESLFTCARFGVKTIGIDLRGALGGNATLGCVNFAPYWPINVPGTLDAFERKAKSLGVELAYETAVTGAFLEGRRIIGLRLCRNGISRNIRAKIVIDATGAAAVARLAGAKVSYGRRSDGGQFTVARTYLFENEKGATFPSYTGVCESPSGDAKSYAALVTSLSVKRLRMRRRNLSRVLMAAPMLGAREEARIEAERVYTFREALFAPVNDTPIFFTYTPYDIHRATDAADRFLESDESVQWVVICGLHSFSFSGAVPYFSLLPKNIEGMLIPSRHFGIDHDALAGIRMISEMRKTGYASAAAATIAIRKGISLKEVAYNDLRPLLEKGNLLSRPVCTGVGFCRPRHAFPLLDGEGIVEALSRDVSTAISWVFAQTPNKDDHSAWAYFCAWRLKECGTSAERKAAGDSLAKALCDPKAVRYSANYAVALALLGDIRAKDVLLDIVRHPGERRDPVVDCAYPNRIKALWLLGLLDAKEAVPELKAIIADGAKAYTASLLRARATTKQYASWVYPFNGSATAYQAAALAAARTALKKIETASFS